MTTPEPIPLRALTVLLNYERMIADDRFRGTVLTKSTFADPSLFPPISSKVELPSTIVYVLLYLPRDLLKILTKTNICSKKNYHEFQVLNPPPKPGSESTICEYIPTEDVKTKYPSLGFAQRELVYYETRSHDGCYKAVGLFELFFGLCPKGQTVSIQITNEVSTFPANISQLLTRLTHRIQSWFPSPLSKLFTSKLGVQSFSLSHPFPSNLALCTLELETEKLIV